MKRHIISLSAAFLLALCFAVPALALDDGEFDGYAADTLTITVGYFGGPYYQKAVFSESDLWSLDVQYFDYTLIDNMPSVVIDHVAGVTLADILDASGIDLNSVQSFNFWTRDKQSDYYTSITKKYLIDTARYCYYSLPDNFDYDEGAGNEYALADKVRVPTMLALGDDWNRSIAGASFGSDYQNLNTNTRYRLVFGQTDATEHTASRSAKWIHKIEITLGGAPTVTMDASVLDLEVGSKYRAEARVSAADSAIAENTAIEWSSSDEKIATVDGYGTIEVHAAGSAVIMARAGDSSASIAVNGTPAAAGAGSPALAPGSGGGGTVSETDEFVTGEGAQGSSPTATGAQQNPAAEPGVSGAPAAVDNTKSTVTAREISILPQTGAQPVYEGEGGVQNWRAGAMADTAVELPVIPEANPMAPVMITGALAFLIIGGGIEYAFYRKQRRA